MKDMKPGFVFLMFLLSGFMFADTAIAGDFLLPVVQKPHGFYPDRFVLATVKDASGVDFLEYHLIQKESGRVLATIPCAYQPSLGAEEWVRERSQGADIYWSADGRHAALDESNHRMIGSVYVVELQTGSQPVVHRLSERDFPRPSTDELMSARIMVGEKGWIDNHHLGLTCAYRFHANNASRYYFGNVTASFNNGKLAFKVGPEIPLD